AWLGAAVCAVVLGAGCGSTQSSSEKEAQARSLQGEPTATTAPGDQGAPSSGTPVESTPAALDAARPATPAAPASGSPGVSSAAPSASAAPKGTTKPGPGRGTGSESAPAASPRPNQAASATPGAPTPQAPGQPAPGGPRPEIVIGSIGVRSGPIGAVLAPIEHGARAWAADANARGGLNG